MIESGNEELGDEELRELARLSKEEKRRLKSAYGQLYSTVSEILFRNDPIGFNFDENTDEYEPEVGTILPRLQDCTILMDVRRTIHQEFVRWFDSDIAGPEDKYQRIAEEVWIAWKQHRLTS